MRWDDWLFEGGKTYYARYVQMIEHIVNLMMQLRK